VSILYYAAGGGHGHALRGMALLERLGTGVLAAPARLAGWAAARGVSFLPLRDDRLREDAAALPPPELLLVDVFPRGPIAELPPLLERAGEAWLVSRRVPPGYYLDPPVREAIEARYKLLAWTEEPPVSGLRVRQVRTGPVLLRTEPLPRTEGRRRLLALGAGPREGQKLLHRLLEKIAARLDLELRFVSDLLPVEPAFPAASLLSTADVVVSAAGYHSFHEIEASGVPAVYLPQDRSHDDQDARAAGRLTARTPEELEARVVEALARGRGPGVSFPDGAARLARLVQRRVEAGVLPEEEIAAMA
jgi:hypothetical protein